MEGSYKFEPAFYIDEDGNPHLVEISIVRCAPDDPMRVQGIDWEVLAKQDDTTDAE